jgi:hypothetical protein
MRRLLVSLLLLAAFPAAAVESVRATLCDPKVVFVVRPGRLPWPAVEPPDRYLVELVAQSGQPARLEAEGSPEDPTYLRVTLPAPLPPDVDFALVVRRPSGETVGEAVLSTKPQKVTIKPSGAAAEAHFRFDVDAPLPLGELAEHGEVELLEVVHPALRVRAGGPRVPEKVIRHGVDFFRPPRIDCTGPRSASSAIVDLRPGDRLHDGSTALRLVGLKDVFGRPVTAEGVLLQPKIPKGKDDAAFFAKILFESAKGSADAYSLDLRIRPQLALRGRWLFRPELTAFVAENVPGATDSIRLSALFSHTSVRQDRSLVAQTLSLGPAMHADRDFDRVNVLLDLRWQPDWKGQYQPRENKRFALAMEEGVKPEEVALPAYGFGFDAVFAVEAGRTVRSETLADDGRDVLRLRPHLHGFVELGRLTLDLSSSLRYLVVEEAGVDGFRPYTEATLSFAFDPAKHLALAVTYKDGSEPPLFLEVEKVSVGIVAKY